MAHHRMGVLPPVSSVFPVVPGHWHQLSSPQARLRQEWRQMGPGRKGGRGGVESHGNDLEPCWGVCRLSFKFPTRG